MQDDLSSLDGLCARVDSSPNISCADSYSISSPAPSVCSSQVLIVFKDIKAELKYKGYSPFFTGTQLYLSVKINMPNSTNSGLLQFETLSTCMLLGVERELEIDSLLGEFQLNFPIYLTFGVHTPTNFMLAATAGCVIQDYEVAYNQYNCDFHDLSLLNSFGVQCGYLSFKIGIFSMEHENLVVEHISHRRMSRANSHLKSKISTAVSISSLLAAQSSILEEENLSQKSRMLLEDEQIEILFNNLDQFYIGTVKSASASKIRRLPYKDRNVSFLSYTSSSRSRVTFSESNSQFIF